MSHRTRKEILERLRRRYRHAGSEHKRKLLDQAQELLGYHRKSAVRALRAPPLEPAPWINTGRPLSYDPKVLLPWLRPIWQATDYACGRRLVAMLPEWLAAYEVHERRVPTEAREKLLSASARTLDRLLQPLRCQAQGRSLTRPGTLLRHQIWGFLGPQLVQAWLGGRIMTRRWIWIVTRLKTRQRGNRHLNQRFQPTVMKTKPFSLLLFSVIALFGVAPDRPGFGQDQTKPVLKKEAKTDKAGAESGANPAAAAQKSASADPEERFKALFTKATLSGRSAPLTDGVLGEEKTGDKYSIVSATKGSGDAWTVNARMKYRDQEMIIPVPVQMKFVGDVAILEVNNLMIPDGGTYTARLMIYDRTYSGTWKGPRGGGMIYGTITNERE